jgi:hypothetical protein
LALATRRGGAVFHVRDYRLQLCSEPLLEC